MIRKRVFRISKSFPKVTVRKCNRVWIRVDSSSQLTSIKLKR
jgi:hypothetical protein